MQEIMEMPEQQNRGTLDITSNWNILWQQLKAQFPQLTETDLKLEAGKESELYNRIEARLDKKRYEVINIIRKGYLESA